MYRIGRVYLHHDAPRAALKWFQLGQPAAQAEKLLGRSQDELTRADLTKAPDWARFYNETDMHAMIGTVHTVLSAIDVKHAAIAIPALNQCLAHYDESKRVTDRLRPPASLAGPAARWGGPKPGSMSRPYNEFSDTGEPRRGRDHG